MRVSGTNSQLGFYMIIIISLKYPIHMMEWWWGVEFELGYDLFCSSATLIIYHGRHQLFSNKPVKTRGVRQVCPHLERSNICLHLLALCYDLSGTPGTGFAWDMGLAVLLGTGYTVIVFLRVLQMFIANPHLSLSFTIIQKDRVRETKGAQKNSLNIYV